MDVDALEKNKGIPLLNKLEEFGYWPMLHGNKWNINDYNLTKLLSQVRRSRDVRPLFNFEYFVLNKTTFKYTIVNDVESFNSEELNLYKPYLKETMILLSNDYNISFNNSQFDNSFSEIISFQTELTKLFDEENYFSFKIEQKYVQNFSVLRNLIDVVSIKF